MSSNQSVCKKHEREVCLECEQAQNHLPEKQLFKTKKNVPLLKKVICHRAFYESQHRCNMPSSSPTSCERCIPESDVVGAMKKFNNWLNNKEFMWGKETLKIEKIKKAFVEVFGDAK